MKRIALVIVLLLVAVLCLTACDKVVPHDFGEEIIVNGTFEENNLNGWTYVASSDDTTSPEIKTLNESHDNVAIVGTHYLSVKGSKYSGYTQAVSLEKGQYYYLSAKVRVPSALTADADNAGAFVAIDSDYSLAGATVKSKNSEWKTIGVYFNSDTRTAAVVRFGVGTEEYTASGTAEFDSISLVKVESVPENVTAYNLSTSDSEAAFDKLYRTDKEGRIFMILTVVLGALVLFAAYAALRTLMGRKDAFLTEASMNAPVSFFKSSAFFLILVELLAFAVRLIVINFVYGGSSLASLVTESTRLTDLGASKYYYENTVLTPIGSLYLLWAMGALASPLKLVAGGMGFSIFLKIPAVLADLVIVFLIYYLANRKYNPYISAIFAGVYAIVPTFFFLSAGWGSFLSLGVLFILLSLISFLDKKYVMGVVYYAIALLFSTEAMLLLPLLLVYLFYLFFKTDDYKMGISISLTSCIIGLYLISIPFILTHFTEGHPFIVVKRYCQAFLAHTGFTENAFSIYGLFGLGASAANTVSYVFNGILVALMMVYVVLLFFKSRSRLDLMLLGAFAFVFTFVMTSAVDVLLGAFGLVLLLTYGMIVGDRRVLKLFGGLTLTTLLNTAYAMMIGGYFGVGSNSALVLMTASDPVLILFSIVNLLLLAYFAYITASICIKEEVKGVKVIEGNYFAYAWSEIKSCGKAIADFFTVKLPALFKKGKLEGTEDGDAR
ncbi:MAG: carbohydrate binding domain-containing protein [Clostridia bacterium]|nr:carbohydrate binding domain-containing protein [Clostridia bacterium]